MKVKNATVYQVAKALVQDHNFVYDVAFLAAWYSRNTDMPTATPAQIVARMAMVRNVPSVSPAEAERMLLTYRMLMTYHQRI